MEREGQRCQKKANERCPPLPLRSPDRRCGDGRSPFWSGASWNRYPFDPLVSPSAWVIHRFGPKRVH